MTRQNPLNPEDEYGPGARQPCVVSADIPAYVQGELDSEAESLMEAHLAVCSPCSIEEAELQQLLAGLHLMSPEPTPAQGLEGRLMSQVRKRAIAPFRAIGPTATALLGMLVAVTLINAILQGSAPHASWSQSSRVHPLMASAIMPPAWPTTHEEQVWSDRSWLLASQNADGSWRPGDHGGRAQWCVAMTGLALIALSSDEGTAQLRPVTHALDRGVAFLKRSQDTEGRFGKPEVGGNYNHILATWGLRAVYDRYPQAPIRISLSRARHSGAGELFGQSLRSSKPSITLSSVLASNRWEQEGGNLLRVCARLIQGRTTTQR